MSEEKKRAEKISLSLNKIQELIVALGAMEIALIKLLKKEIGGTAQEVLQEYCEMRRAMGHPLTDADYARLIHQAEQADAEDEKKRNE